MKYIHSYEIFNVIEEKLGWKDLLLGGIISASVLLSSLNKHFNKKESKLIYSEIIKDNINNPYIENKIDSIKKVLLEEVRNSNYENKQILLDTIKYMPFLLLMLKKILNQMLTL